jgi:endonuclease/exonuclease/phosphatase family metal-dependent hydrolase
MPGTAIVAKCQHHFTNILTLPTGRAIAATFRGVRPINIYALSGTARRAEREDFYNEELTHLLQDANKHILLAGDFNCVLHPNDTAGRYHTSRALTEIVGGMALTYTWTQNPLRPSYTHYTSNCASRLDRFYVTGDILTQKLGIETLPAAFTDHLVVVLRISVDSFEL